MRPAAVFGILIVVACRGRDGEHLAAPDGPPVISVELDRASIAATDVLSGELRVVFGTPPRGDDGDARQWCASLLWRFELANETAPLLELVVDREPGANEFRSRALPAGGTMRARFRVVPCEALVARSSEANATVRLLEPGHHALRLVLIAFPPNPWQGVPPPGTVPLDGSFASRWIPFDVDLAGRSLDAADAEALVQAVDTRRAGAVLGDFARRQVLSFDRCFAAVARAEGNRRGRLAEACVTECGCGTAEALDRLAPLFAPVDEAGLDWTSHEAPPCFVRLARGKVVPVRDSGSTDCITFLYAVDRRAEQSFAADLHVEPDESAVYLLRPKDTSRMSAKRGLFRAVCDTHHRTWGWLLIE